jgi:hypothetical protein
MEGLMVVQLSAERVWLALIRRVFETNARGYPTQKQAYGADFSDNTRKFNRALIQV